MGERIKGALDRSWRPPGDIGRALFADILARFRQHSDEGTLPRGTRGLFYDLRPAGMGNGLTYIKQPPMWCVRGEHIIDGEGRCRIHGGSSRRADPSQVGPHQVQEMLVLMRRAAIIPENWVEDRRAPTPDRPYYTDATADEVAGQILDQIRYPDITYSPQRGQDVHVEVMVEAAGLIGRCARICRPLGVPVYGGAGFAGLKGKRAFASRAADRDVPTVVLLISDLDPHGLLITDSLEADCLAWATGYYGARHDQLRFDRIALTEDQAIDADLLDADGKAEAEGLPVPVMDAIVTGAIEALMDMGIVAANLAEAEEETARVTDLVLAALRENGEQ